MLRQQAIERRKEITEQVRSLRVSDSPVPFSAIEKTLGLPVGMARRVALRDVRPRVFSEVDAGQWAVRVWGWRNDLKSDRWIADQIGISYFSFRAWFGNSGLRDKQLEQKRQVQLLYSRDVPRKQILAGTGVSESSYIAWVRQYREANPSFTRSDSRGKPKKRPVEPRKVWTAEDKAKAVLLRAQSFSLRAISREIGCAKSTARLWVGEL